MLNTPIGDYDLKAFRPLSEVFMHVCVSVCVSYSHIDLSVSLVRTSV